VAAEAFKVIREDGTPVEGLDPELPEKDLVALYRWMLLVRALDAKSMRMQRQGRIGFYVPCQGQEAAQVGSAWALGEGDWVFPAYREPGAALIRGYPLKKLICQFIGNSEDASKGRQMPNHFGYREANYVVPSSPVGTQIIQAVGAAWAAKLRGDPIVVLTYFGDGATSQGDFHCALNFGGVFKTPVIFFCNNNQYALSLPFSRQTASASIAVKAEAYGIEGVRVDGNDVLASYAVTKEAADRARETGMPTLIEAVTYRLGPHSSSDDPKKYRTDEELKAWEARDPIPRFARYLERRGLWSQERDKELRRSVDEELGRAVELAEEAPPPAYETIFSDVYEDVPWHLAEQMEDFLAHRTEA
jgi:2-oxoisovalerate dehydrogenase E1 component alpha subunit